MDVGRMAVIADPAGAALCLWEPRAHIGAALVNAPGALAWNDLDHARSRRPPRASTATCSAGRLSRSPAPATAVIQNDGRSNGGITSREGVPPSWIPYFGHADVDALVARIGALAGPMTVPTAASPLFADPQGAVFAALTATTTTTEGRSPRRECRRDVSGVAAARATTSRRPTITVAVRARVIAV